MKKIISVFLSILFICSLTITETSVGAKTNTDKYQKKVKNAYKSCLECGEYYPNSSQVGGFLYDFDGNGVKELVLTYFKNVNVNGYAYPHLVCSVYTIKKNKVKAVIKKKVLYTDVGGPYAAVGVAKKNGKKYLFCYDETGGTGADRNSSRSGEIILYKIKGAKATKKVKARYTIKSDTTKLPAKIKNTNIKLNAKKISYKKFIKWQKSYKLSKVKRNKGFYWKYTYASKFKGLSDILG